jgi:2-desacetyl-2-hydroxyethyl bacteriochlorophyllide A dehydrogenase
MRALTVQRPGVISLDDRPDPRPADGATLIAPSLVGMCGTDLDIIDGRIDPAFVRYPIVLGHEWVGTVMAGSDVALPAGTRVVVEGVVPCGRCRECAAGDTNRCVTYDEFGFTRDGAAADLLVAPARLVHPLAPHVSLESAALVEPTAVVLRALARAAPKPGQQVLVIGDGTVALIAARLVRLWSPGRVVMLGARPAQDALARQAGVDEFATDAAVVDGGFDLVIEAAGAQAACSAALAAPVRGGTVVLLGFPGVAVAVPLVVDDLVNGDVTVMGSFSYTSAAWRQVVVLLNTGRLDLAFLVTHRFSLRDYAAAIEALRHPSGERGKVLVEVAPQAWRATTRPANPA